MTVANGNTSPRRSTLSPAERSARSRYAANRRHNPDREATRVLAAESAVDTLARQIAKVLEQAPPLSEEQLSRLALLLSPVT